MAKGDPVQTVQQTSKPIKLVILSGAVFFWFGVFGLFSAESGSSEAADSALMLWGGLALYLCGRFLRWWNHG